jgi:hypothetical protein
MSDHGPVAQKGVGEGGVTPPPIFLEGTTNRLNMQLDLKSLFGLNVHSCTHWRRKLQVLLYQ